MDESRYQGTEFVSLLYWVTFVAGVGCGSVGAGVEKWSDLTGQVEVGVSSRPAMVASLTDGSTGRPPRPTSLPDIILLCHE